MPKNSEKIVFHFLTGGMHVPTGANYVLTGRYIP